MVLCIMMTHDTLKSFFLLLLRLPFLGGLIMASDMRLKVFTELAVLPGHLGKCYSRSHLGFTFRMALLRHLGLSYFLLKMSQPLCPPDIWSDFHLRQITMSNLEVTFDNHS